jgi:hypothetical protein
MNNIASDVEDLANALLLGNQICSRIARTGKTDLGLLRELNCPSHGAEGVLQGRREMVWVLQGDCVDRIFRSWTAE